MTAAKLPESLDRLRRKVAEIAGFDEILLPHQSFRVGIPGLDAALGGGLPRGALHDCAPAAPIHRGAATGFVLGLAALAQKPLFWLQTELARQEAGFPYGTGCETFGLPMRRIILLRVRKTDEALGAAEEVLKCCAAGGVIAELTDDIDLTATRRLALAAREHGGLGFLLRHRVADAMSAAATRWEIAAAPGARDPYGGLGATAFSLALVKNRRGPCGRWIIRWDHHAHAFAPAAFSFGVAPAARDGSDRASLARTG